MAGWGEFIAAYVVFLASHAIPVRPPVKPWLVARLGRAGYAVVYSALSLAVLVWLIVAAGRAPYVQIWPRTTWASDVTLLSMTLACAILALAAFRPNPLSFGGWRNGRFDPARPGIVGWVRHPVLAALALWSVGHLVPNGDLAHVILFGGFAGFALLGMRLIDRRRKRELGAVEWRRLAHGGRGFSSADGLVLRALVALVLVVALNALHPVVIGVPGWVR